MDRNIDQQDSGSTISFHDALVYFSYAGTEHNHKFTTDLNDTTKINVERNLIKVSTAQTHGLSVNDNFNLNVTTGISTIIKSYIMIPIEEFL